jgi:hypothetical protein
VYAVGRVGVHLGAGEQPAKKGAFNNPPTCKRSNPASARGVQRLGC